MESLSIMERINIILMRGILEKCLLGLMMNKIVTKYVKL